MKKTHTKSFFCLAACCAVFWSAVCLTCNVETATGAQAAFTCVEHTATNAAHETARRAESSSQFSGCGKVTLFSAVGSGELLGDADSTTTLAEIPRRLLQQ